MQDEFVNVFGIEEPAIPQHPPVLPGVKGIVLEASAGLARRGVLVEQPAYNFTAHQRLVHNFGHVFHAHLGVKNPIRNYRNQRAHLAKALAAALRQPQVPVPGFRPKLKNHIQSCSIHLLAEALKNLHCAVRHAPGPGTQNHAPHSRLAVVRIGSRVQNYQAIANGHELLRSLSPRLLASPRRFPVS